MKKARDFWLADAHVTIPLANGEVQEVRLAFSKEKGVDIGGNRIDVREVVDNGSIRITQEMVNELHAFMMDYITS